MCVCIQVRGTFSSQFYTNPDSVLCDELPQKKKKQINRLPVSPKEEMKGKKDKSSAGLPQ